MLLFQKKLMQILSFDEVWVRRIRTFYTLKITNTIMLACFILLGCKSKMPFTPSQEEAVPHPQRVNMSSDTATMKMQKKLASCGVKVITIGEDYLISVPSAALFPNQSPRLTWPGYSLLNNIAKYLKQFHIIGVNVTGYSSRYVSAKREHALTFARAWSVANYLWSQGIDSRFIFTEGMGSDKPIMVSTQGGDKAYNSRIEITFRDATV